ncbi:MAG: hypothetical protein QF890_15610 [Myxococcota bacterium]|jgi:hypothetical protein|nr:hypothetical protein [Myxococcota bacterium]MDP6242138.1 hypothetical protein [Myxococcota bacterium]MDP7074741.1 hypothetical protein [Myxococcota bacterium]MDP7298938.1 hypothetical protein [Myxococcota bacterium]MDP7433984.1 hypothetical protein [Myxococcota bacterium]
MAPVPHAAASTPTDTMATGGGHLETVDFVAPAGLLAEDRL